MTEPTDAEILAVIREVSRGSAMRREGGLSLRIARAVLAKWGAQPAVERVPLTDEQIEAMPVWRNFVGLWPESRREIVDAVVDLLAAAPTPPAQAADSVLEDAARYRYLRDGDWREHEELESVIRLQLNTLWDAKIDAARAAQKGGA